MSRVAAVVVTFNRRALLMESISALLQQTFQELDIFVIDNASTDGTREAVEGLLPNARIHYHNTGANLGGAGGFNFGLKMAYPEGYDYFWLMDDDSIPEPDALQEIITAAEILDDRFGFLCANVRWTDGAPCRMNIPRIDPAWINDAELIKRGIVPVQVATFVGFFISRETVEKIGLPIKEFFIWSDDTNYSLRAGKVAPCYCAMNSRITHKMKANTSSDIVTDPGDRAGRYFYSYRNKLFNARYEHKVAQYLLQFIKQTFQVLFRSKYKFRKLHSMYKGLLSGIFFSPDIEYVRNNNEQ